MLVVTSSYIAPAIRTATNADLPAMAGIYAHHVLHGTASFETDPPSAGARVSISPQLPTYTNGARVTLTASPPAGYSLLNWSGDATGNAVELILTVDGNKSVLAQFGASVQATIDRGTIETWWAGRKGARVNIGVSCGAAGLVVLDADGSMDPRDIDSYVEALAAGADILVIGRAITGATDPVASCRAIAAELR